MSVQRKEYFIIGCKLGSGFTKKLWDREDIKDHEWEYGKKDVVQYLTDGMNGDYTFIGFIQQIYDGFDEEPTEEIELLECTPEIKEEIVLKFKELFPGVEIPPIKTYYLPHYA